MLPDNPRPSLLRRVAPSVLVGILTTGLVLISGVAFTASTAQADDSSAVTVTAAEQDPDVANSPLPGIRLTVSQTKGLVSQAIVLSWTGGTASERPSSQNGGSNFLQFAQCWGDDPSIPAGQPAQPDRTTCQYGGFNQAGTTRDHYHSTGSAAAADAAYTVAEAPLGDYTSIPFHAVDGTVYTNIANGKRVSGVDPNTNQFFTKYTTNEVPWAGSGDDGSGSIKFEVQTKVQAPGLGCGDAAASTTVATSGRACWLVAIPRGTADSGSTQVDQSGLFADQWKHRLAVRLDFRPIGNVCAIGAAERQLQGSELVAAAVASWQPALCTAKGGDAYTILTATEGDAVSAANSAIPGPMALTSRPLSSGVTDSLTYAPVALTGLAVSFAIDRQPSLDGKTPQQYLDRTGLPFSSMKLTPRLVAKLLTDSYRDALPYDADRSHLASNPRNILFDPDFQSINDPEWKYQAIASPAIADALVPQGRSDAAWAVWSYVMADADARSFLAGTPDRWGMKVNKWASNSKDVAPKDTDGQSLAQTYPADSFPKADPVEIPAQTNGPGAINLVTWRPFTSDLDNSAYRTLRGDGQVLGGWNTLASPPGYDKQGRDLPGSQRVIGVTDTASAFRYLTVTAALQNPAGEFVVPTAESMTAAAAAMTVAPSQAQVYGFDPTSAAAKAAPTAYPLTMPVYAAANPAMTDAGQRASYAAFIRYAVSDTAQTPGATVGQLPAGYAPLPAGWRTQARSAADRLAAGVAAPTDAGSPDFGSSGSGSDTGSFASSGGTSFGAASDGAGAAEAAGNPSATGALSSALAASKTPADPKLAGVGSTLPLSLLAGVIGALATTVVSRIRRRT